MPRRDVELCPGEYYHLYNRGNNRGRVFFARDNYLFFLRRVGDYLCPVLDIVAYCLMPTHYHLLVGVKTSDVSETSEVAGAVSRAMQRLGISYTKAMNKRYDRTGALFQGGYRSKHIGENEYLVHLSRYIHLNPVIDGALLVWASSPLLASQLNGYFTMTVRRAVANSNAYAQRAPIAAVDFTPRSELLCDAGDDPRNLL